MATTPIPACAFSVLETDVLELAMDPSGFGLDDDERASFRLLASMVNGSRLLVPTTEADRATAWRLLCDLANTYDDQAEAGRSCSFSRAASRGLQTLAAKVIR